METFVVFAPVRASLSGDLIDLWPLYCFLDHGTVVNAALELGVTAHFELDRDSDFCVEVVAPTGEHFSFREPLSMSRAKRLRSDLRVPVGIVSEYMARRAELPGGKFRITLSTTVPKGSGLGEEAAVAVALVRGLSRIFGDYVEQGWQWQVLRWMADFEAAFALTGAGTEAALASLFGGLNSFLYRIGSIDRVPYPSGVFEEVSRRLVVLFAGPAQKDLGACRKFYQLAVSGDENALSAVEKLSHVSDDLDDELRAGNLNWKYIGQCLKDDWKVRKDMLQIHNPRLDEMTQFLNQKTVYGARVCGSFSGGSLVVLVDPDFKQKIIDVFQKSGLQVLSAQASSKPATFL